MSEQAPQVGPFGPKRYSMVTLLLVFCAGLSSGHWLEGVAYKAVHALAALVVFGCLCFEWGREKGAAKEAGG
jgi:hypothetical protein